MFGSDAHSRVCVCKHEQTHHTIVTQLLQSSVRLLDCPWLQQQHRGQVETCIRTLSSTGNGARRAPPPSPTDSNVLCVCAAKSRSISLPLELEAQINSMPSTLSHPQARSSTNYKSAARSTRAIAPSNPWDYKNIIEKLQVGGKTDTTA